MNEIIKICGIALIGLAATAVMRGMKNDFASFAGIATGLVLLGFALLRNREEKCQRIMRTLKIKPLCFMALIGAAAYTGNFLHLLAANGVPASVQFPLVSGGVIVLSALVSAFAFREKLSYKEWISVVGAFASTVLFAF